MRKNVFLALLLGIIVCVGCATSSLSASGTITAFVNVNVVPLTEEIVLEAQVVLVDGDRIVAVGDGKEVKIPKGAAIVDGNGAYLMPGLADMHVHIYEESIDELPVPPFNLHIAKGVTTIRDCGTAPIHPSDTFVLDWRDKILSGEMLGPMIYSSGRTIHGPVRNPGGVVRERYSNGFDFAKLYMELSINDFTEAQNTAEELGFYTVGHIPYQVGLDQAIALGLDEIAHLEELSYELIWLNHRPEGYLSGEEWLSSLITTVLQTYDFDAGSDVSFDSDHLYQLQGEQLDHIIDILLTNDIGVGTTLAVGEVVDMKLFNQEEFLTQPESKYLFPALLEEVQNGQNRHQRLYKGLGEYQDLWQWKSDLDLFLLHELHQGGVRFISGTDAGSSSIGVVEGFATHDDLRILTENGFTPYEALLTATVNAAYVVEKMGGDGDFGTVEIGNIADLVLVRGNPLDDIQNTENIEGVMVRGQWYSQEELENMIVIDEEE
jgi:hypothetical protein